MNELHIGVNSKSKLWLKYLDRGIRITAKPSLGELDGEVDITWIDTKKDEGFLNVSFTDPSPYLSVYESDGHQISLGFGTSLTEGVRASISMTAKNAEDFIKDIQRQLDKRAHARTIKKAEEEKQE